MDTQSEGRKLTVRLYSVLHLLTTGTTYATVGLPVGDHLVTTAGGLGGIRTKKTFLDLDPEKQERFLLACAVEFAQYGYELASTNRIVGQLGIAKGSFFKYAESKADVYLYLAETTLEDLGRIQADPATFRSPDLLVRVEELFRGHMAYARREPARYRLVLRAFLDSRAPLYPELVALRAKIAGACGNSIHDGVDWDMYGFPQAEVMAFLQLLDTGLRQSLLQGLGDNTDPATLETIVTRTFDLVRRILRDGIYSAGREGPR